MTRVAPKRRAALRNVLSWLAVGTAVLALFATGSVVAFGAHSNRVSSRMERSVRSVRLAERAEVDLLVHDRADELTRPILERDLRRQLRRARRYAKTEPEVRALREAEIHVDGYLADPTPAAQHAAFVALRGFVDVTTRELRRERARAISWNERADGIAIGVATAVLVAVAVLLVWLRRRAFAPVLELGCVMERFGRGDWSARAREEGPEELEHMARRFNDMAEALALQRRAQTAFLGGVAHDLRSPLQALRLATALLSNDDAVLLERIDRQISRLERMVADFLDAAKIDAGQLDLRLARSDLRDIVNRVVEMFRESPSKHPIEVSMPAGACAARCDAWRIEQVLVNLLSNAIKYSLEGRPVGVTLRRDGDEAVLEVSDQGIGIDAEDQQHVFEPFRRVGLSKETVPGVGLGLYVVRNIVEAHGGRIAVESKPGEGSTFRVRLPLVRPEEPLPATA